MSAHIEKLDSFQRRLTLLLVFRAMVQWMIVWFFLWGVVVLAARMAHVGQVKWLLIGSLGFIPAALFAAIRELRRKNSPDSIRAAFDRFNHCGGVIMAQEAADMSAWQALLPEPSRPKLRWSGGRSFSLLLLAVAFVLVAACLPERFATLGAQRPLEIGKLVGELRAEVETLKQEKILDEVKAEDLQNQLSHLKERSSGNDPAKTWEALDHIKESNSDLARQAAEEALAKTSSLTEAQTLAAALQLASESGLGQEAATRAVRDLAAMMKAAKLDDGLLRSDIPEDLLSALDGLTREDLEKLMSLMAAGKGNLGRTMTNLTTLKLIDPKLLSQCQNAGQCPNPSALAAFLCQNTNACNLAALTESYCRGGINRGRGDAPMTWKDASTDDGAKFKEQALPPSSRLADSQLAGVSRSAPELSGNDVVAEHGALAGAQGSGGSAHAQVILPRHRQTVQKFFKRDE